MKYKFTNIAQDWSLLEEKSQSERLLERGIPNPNLAPPNKDIVEIGKPRATVRVPAKILGPHE